MKMVRLTFKYGTKLNPTRDWNVLVTLALICFVASVIWNVWLFEQVASGAALGSPTSTVVAPLDQSTLDALTQIFADRAREQAKYTDGTYRFIDPSK